MKLRRKTVLSSELEDELANYCAVMEEKFFSLHACDIRQLALQPAAKNNPQNPFIQEKERVEKK